MGYCKFIHSIEQILTYLLISFISVSSTTNDIRSTSLESECSFNKLIVEGFDIYTSDVLNISCFRTVKFIEIFAVNKFVVDADIDRTELKVQLSIVAPTFEIVGQRKINLSGKFGQPPSPQKALPSVGNGRDGKPGNPGGSSGSILVISKLFINENNCEIYINGGDGGAGQDGGNGMNIYLLLFKGALKRKIG